MRIVIVQGAFLPVPPLRGGAVEKMWHRLATEFSAGGHDVTHISRLCDGLSAREIVGGVNHVRIRGGDTPRALLRLKAIDLLYSLRARGIIEPADIIITNTFWLPMLLRNPHRWGRVVVDFQRMPKGQVRFYNHVSCIRANSSAVRGAIIKEHPAAGSIVRHIPNPLPFDPPDSIEFDSKKKVVLYAGRIHPEKGLDMMARVWAKIHTDYPGWSVELAGPHAVAEGGGGDGYRDRLKQLFGNSPVIWHGPVHNAADLELLYRKAMVFIYPSIAGKGETFGLAPLEGMAYGAVPILSALECFNEFGTDGQNVIVFDHRSPAPEFGLELKIRDLLDQPDKIRAMAGNAAKCAHDFAPDVIAERFLQLFEDILKT